MTVFPNTFCSYFFRSRRCGWLFRRGVDGGRGGGGVGTWSVGHVGGASPRRRSAPVWDPGLGAGGVGAPFPNPLRLRFHPRGSLFLIPPPPPSSLWLCLIFFLLIIIFHNFSCNFTIVMIFWCIRWSCRGCHREHEIAFVSACRIRIYVFTCIFFSILELMWNIFGITDLSC